MKNSHISFFKIFSAVLTLTAMGSSHSFIYIVQENETLSQIIDKHLGSPIYGKKGNLKLIKSLNPELNNVNKIYKSQRLVLAPTTVDRVPTNESPAPKYALPSHVTFPENSKVKDQLIFAPKFFYTTITGIDKNDSSKATLLSKLNYGADVSWFQEWTNNWGTHIYLGMDKVRFEQASSKQIKNAYQSLSRFGVGGSYTKNKLKVGLNLGVGQEVFYRGTSSGELTLNSLVIPRANVFADYTLFEKEPFKLGSKINFGYLHSAKSDLYNISSGISYGAALYLKKKFATSDVGAEVFYQRTNQNSDLVKQERIDLGLAMNVSWRFGE